MSIHTYATLEVARQHQMQIAKQYAACQARSASTLPGRAARQPRLSLRVAGVAVALLMSVAALVLVAVHTSARTTTNATRAAATSTVRVLVVGHGTHPSSTKNWA
jgi:hypothetical protein